MPIDINKKYGLERINKEEMEVIFETDPANPPEEFKDYSRNIN